MPTWDVVSRYAAQHSTARSSKPKPLAWRSPLRRRGRALATYATPRRPAHPPPPPTLRSAPARQDGTAPAGGPSPHHARSPVPSSDPTRRPPGWRRRAGTRRNSPVSPSTSLTRPPAASRGGLRFMPCVRSTEPPNLCEFGFVCFLACSSSLRHPWLHSLRCHGTLSVSCAATPCHTCIHYYYGS